MRSSMLVACAGLALAPALLTGCGSFNSGAKAPSATAPTAQTQAPASMPGSEPTTDQVLADLTTPTPMTPARSTTPLASVTSNERFNESGPLGEQGLAQISFAEEGADFDPSLTPDGHQMVFASTQHTPTSDLFIKDVQGSVVTQLTSDPAEDLQPSVSPDGNRIAFASNRSGNWDIYIMPIAGGKAVAITNSAADELHPSWSPDGSRLVYCRLGPVSRRWEMWVSQAANPSSTHFVGYGLFPQWCPVAGTGTDGSDKILFQLSRERGARTFGIWTIDYKPSGQTTANATALATKADAALINPAWSPDGQYIVYSEVSTPKGRVEINQTMPTKAELWVMAADGTERARLSSANAVALMAAFGPANQLYFVTDRAGESTVWSMDVGPTLAAMNTNNAETQTANAPEAAGEADAHDAPAQPAGH